MEGTKVEEDMIDSHHAIRPCQARLNLPCRSFDVSVEESEVTTSLRLHRESLQPFIRQTRRCYAGQNRRAGAAHARQTIRRFKPVPCRRERYHLRAGHLEKSRSPQTLVRIHQLQASVWHSGRASLCFGASMRGAASIIQAMEEISRVAHETSEGQESSQVCAGIRKSQRVVRARIGTVEQDATDMGDVFVVPDETTSTYTHAARIRSSTTRTTSGAAQSSMGTLQTVRIFRVRADSNQDMAQIHASTPRRRGRVH